ncbi:MAG: hypothetical protein GF317_03545 [Candidatus Lokiarchaeota archaeon]|nr:hypothetical protein [Candidatus Lokiarchaeota archaeon]
MDSYSEENLIKTLERMRPGYRAFCATIDLLGVTKMILKRKSEVYHRLNDLQKVFGDALLFFPGGSDFRVTFLGDSLIIVKELSPELKVKSEWPIFCGHIYAISTILHEIELGFDNPGLRVIISYGKLFQISQPDSWRNELISKFTENWYVLTGACEALAKCHKAEEMGKKGGFIGNYCWHENPEKRLNYLGTKITSIPLANYQQPKLYPNFYLQMCQNSIKDAELKFCSWESEN